MVALNKDILTRRNDNIIMLSMSQKGTSMSYNIIIFHFFLHDCMVDFLVQGLLYKQKKGNLIEKKNEISFLQRSRRSSGSSSSSESSSGSDDEEETESRKSKSRSKKRKKEKKHRSRSKHSSGDDGDTGGPLPLSRFFGSVKS